MQLLLLGVGPPEEAGEGGCRARGTQLLLLEVELLMEVGEGDGGRQLLLLGAGSPGEAGPGKYRLQLLMLLELLPTLGSVPEPLVWVVLLPPGMAAGSC